MESVRHAEKGRKRRYCARGFDSGYVRPVGHDRLGKCCLCVPGADSQVPNPAADLEQTRDGIGFSALSGERKDKAIRVK